MFTLQTPDLVRQLRGQIPDAAVSAFEGLLGNCIQPLEHRGPITVEIDGNYMPNLYGYPRGGPLGKNCTGTAVAAITAVNRAGKWVGDPCLTDCVERGLAFRGIGPSHFDSARIDKLYVGSLRDLCGNPIEGVATSGGTEPKRFQITNDSFGSGIALAIEVEWNGSAYATTGDPFVVADFTPTNEFSSRWKNDYYGWCLQKTDRLGVTVSLTDYDLYECLWVESKARWIEFELTSDVTGGTASANVLYAWGADDRADVPSTVTVYDRTGRFADAETGDKGIAVWDEQESKYIPLHSTGMTGVIIPSDPSIFCIKITSGERNASCLYEGIAVEADMTSPNFCTQDFWIDGDSCWVFAPNKDDEDFLEVGSIHLGILLDEAFDVGGDIRPLYMIKDDVEQFELLKFENTSRRDDCTYSAKIVTFGGDYCSDENDTEGEDVYVYLPNSTDLDEKITGPKYAWGKLLKNEYNGRKLFLSKLEIRNSRVLYAIIELDPLECTDDTGTGRFLQFIKQGDHVEDWDDIGEEVEFENTFSFCAESGKKGLLMLNDGEDEKPILVQVEHVCIDLVTNIEASPPCGLSVTKVKASVVFCSESSQSIPMEDVICDCCSE